MIGLPFPKLVVTSLRGDLSLYPFPILFSLLSFFVHFCAIATFSCLLMTLSSALALFLSYSISLPLPWFIFLCPSIISHLFPLLIWFHYYEESEHKWMEVTLLFFLFNYFFPSSSLSYSAVVLKQLYLSHLKLLKIWFCTFSLKTSWCLYVIQPFMVLTEKTVGIARRAEWQAFVILSNCLFHFL